MQALQHLFRLWQSGVAYISGDALLVGQHRVWVDVEGYHMCIREVVPPSSR